MFGAMAKPVIGTPADLLYCLLRAWRQDTSLTPDDWSPRNPSVGQCAVTALVVQDLFGGELLRGCIGEGTHYWNRLPDGQEVDLTSDQFDGEPMISNTETRTRAYVLSYPSTRARYHRLLSNLELSQL
jgi:hypothetical protein